MARPREAWLALLVLLVTALVKTVLSKTIFEQVPLPVAYSLLSALVTWLLVQLPLFWSGRLKVMTVRDFRRLALVSIAVSLDLGMSNIAIALLPLPLQQAIASAIPAATILLERAVTRRPKAPASYLAITLLCGGAVLMHLGSVGQNMHARSLGGGELAMGVAILFAALKYVFAKASLHEWKASYGALGVLFWIETFVALQLLPWALLNGELERAIALAFERGAVAAGMLCAAAALGGFRFFCELLVLRYWSATTLSAANLMAHALVVVVATPYARWHVKSCTHSARDACPCTHTRGHLHACGVCAQAIGHTAPGGRARDAAHRSWYFNDSRRCALLRLAKSARRP